MATPRVDCGNFVLVAAMNRCPCGYYGDPIKSCTCAPSTVTKYEKSISAPLLDRIEIHVEVPRVGYHKLSDDRLEEASELIRQRVERARTLQRRRFFDSTESDSRSSDGGRAKIDSMGVVCNADMRVGEIRQFCELDAAGESLVRAAMG